MKPLLLNEQYRDVMVVVKEIAHIDVANIGPSGQLDKSAIEAEAFYLMLDVMILFCDNYEIILRKVISSEDESESLRKQLNTIKEEFVIVLKSESIQVRT
jgi:hypothetical protein